MTDPKGPLDDAEVSTIFGGKEYRYFRWETKAAFDRDTRGTLTDFAFPMLGVDAACLNPLDVDLAWLLDIPWVCDVRISTGELVGFHTIATHPIFRMLPEGLRTQLKAIILDRRCEEDLTPQRQPAAPTLPAPRTWDGVVVTGPDGIDADGTIDVTRNVPRELTLKLTFTEDGDYTVSVPRSALPMYDAWGIELRRPDEQSLSNALAFKGVTKNQSLSVVLRVLAQMPESIASQPPTLEPRRPFLLSIGGKPNQVHQVRYQALLRKTLLPRIHVYSAARRATLELTSLRGARVLEEAPFTPAVQGSLRTCCNGGGRSALTTYELSAEQRAARVADAEPKVEPASGWFEAPGREPSAFLQAELRPGAVVTISAAPGASVPAGWVTSPPAMQEVIEGFRDPSLDQDHETWWASLPACLSTDKASLPVRMQRFIERIYKTPTRDIPDFLRAFIRVYARHGSHTLAYYAMPDFLSVGGDRNFIRLPISGWVASEIARTFQCILPTGKMALQIYTAADAQRLYFIYKPTEERAHTALYLTHHKDIEAQRARQRYVLGRLTSGHKKELAISPRMFDLEERKDTGKTPSYPVVFWGGVYRYDKRARTIALAHPAPDNAMRSLDAESANIGAAKGIWHPNYHDEYAQGARLISRKAYLRTGAGAWKPVDLVNDVLASSDLHPLISTEAMADPYLPRDPHCPSNLVIPPATAS